MILNMSTFQCKQQQHNLNFVCVQIVTCQECVAYKLILLPPLPLSLCYTTTQQQQQPQHNLDFVCVCFANCQECVAYKLILSPSLSLSLLETQLPCCRHTLVEGTFGDLLPFCKQAFNSTNICKRFKFNLPQSAKIIRYSRCC